MIDQRKCYEHMTRKLFRKAMRDLTDDRDLIEFGTDVTFHGNSLPIGTPTSPLAHHIIMLAFDRWLGGIRGPKIRYADDCFLAFATKEEANEAKWRIMNFWWYVYGLRAKRGHSRVIDLDREAVSFCGYVYRRNPDRKTTDHDKGYTTVRKNIRHNARKCSTDRSWAAYYGILSKTDSYNTMRSIEKKMELSELTEKIKIDRDFDAEPITVGELAKSEFSIYDYELRYKTVDGVAKPEWLRLIVGIAEIGADGVPTGNIRRYTCKTEAVAMVDFMARIDEVVRKSGHNPFPITGCRLENCCGFMFRGSTNRETYCTGSNMTLPGSTLARSLAAAATNPNRR